MIYWIIEERPSTTNGVPNQISYQKVIGYFSPSRVEIIKPTNTKVNSKEG